MKALVTLLPEPYYKNILSLWKEMEERFGFTSVFDTPSPISPGNMETIIKTGI